MKQCLVFGAAPQKTWDFLEGYLKPDPSILCADGGQLHAKALGLQPHCVLGDWDSGGTPMYHVEHHTLPCEKDTTDLQGLLELALKNGYRDFLLCGCLGGRLDHTAFNLFLLEWIEHQGGHGMLVDEYHEVQYLANGTIVIPQNPHYRYLSILPLDSTVWGVTVHGVKYPLERETLYRGQTLTVSNEVTADQCSITVAQGGVLIIRSQDTKSDNYP